MKPTRAQQRVLRLMRQGWVIARVEYSLPPPSDPYGDGYFLSDAKYYISPLRPLNRRTFGVLWRNNWIEVDPNNVRSLRGGRYVITDAGRVAAKETA